MAFDSGLLRHIAAELNGTLGGGRIDRITQPSKDEITILLRRQGADRRLLISAGGNGSYICLTGIRLENPATPPMFCMFLRKHFGGAVFREARQEGFERVLRLVFDTRDELGFASEKSIICELMGRFSNVIITDASDRIIGCLKTVDFSTSEKRQVLTGMTYELPPKQEKTDPFSEGFGREAFREDALSCPDMQADRFITSHYSGISPLIAREAAFRASGRQDAAVRECEDELEESFFGILREIRDVSGRPCLVRDEKGLPAEYSFTRLTHYGPGFTIEEPGTFGELIDSYFGERSREDRIRKKMSDIYKLLKNAETRIAKKIEIQNAELSECSKGAGYKRMGDLLTANIYMLKKGMDTCDVTEYTDDGPKTVTVALDRRLTPAQNAQAYYKKYSKSKSAAVHLADQLEKSARDLEYIRSVTDSLSRAESDRELSEIRAELYHSGYASRMKNYGEKKTGSPSVDRYLTSDGHTVLCGRNNTANDYLTFREAGRNDWWFHVKNQPGSHAVLFNLEGEDDPPGETFTEAAEIAAYNSSARDGVMIPVDYTRVSKVKKPPGSPPGYVTYSSNWTAYVTPDREKVLKMRENAKNTTNNKSEVNGNV